MHFLNQRVRRLVASGLLPERAGQPVRVWAHVSLAELRAMDDGSVLQDQWIAEMAVRWAVHRAAASQTGSDGAAWLDGKAARAVSCDAALIPVVTGQVDPAALDALVGLCLQFTGHGPHCEPAAGSPERTVLSCPVTASALPACGPPRRRRWRCSGTRSSGRPSTWSPARAAWPASCAPSSSAPAWPAPACPWTSAAAPRSPPRSAARSSCATSTAAGPAAATSPPQPVKCTTSATWPTAARPASTAARCTVSPPSRGDPSAGLDRRPAPRRHHHRPQPRRHQNLPQPQPARPRRVAPTTRKHLNRVGSPLNMPRP